MHYRNLFTLVFCVGQAAMRAKRMYSKIFRGLAIVSLVVTFAACNSASDNSSGVGVAESSAQFALRRPESIASPRISDDEYVLDLRINGQVVDVVRDGNQWVGIARVPRGEELIAELSWSVRGTDVAIIDRKNYGVVNEGFVLDIQSSDYVLLDSNGNNKSDLQDLLDDDARATDGEGTGSEGTGSEGTGSEGTGSEGTGGEGTGSEGSGGEGTGGEGTGSEGSGSEGTGGEGTGGEGTGGEGTGSEGTGSEGTGGEGTGSEGTGSEGTGGEGTGSEGTGSEGTGSEGTGSEGTGSEGTGGEGTGSEGTGGEGTGSGEGTTEIRRIVAGSPPENCHYWFYTFNVEYLDWFQESCGRPFDGETDRCETYEHVGWHCFPVRPRADVLTEQSSNTNIKFIGANYDYGDSNYRVYEDETEIVVFVERSGNTSSAIDIEVKTLVKIGGAFATEGGDYAKINQVLRWGIGESGVKSVTIPIVEDDLEENEEVFLLQLSNLINTDDISIFSRAAVAQIFIENVGGF